MSVGAHHSWWQVIVIHGWGIVVCVGWLVGCCCLWVVRGVVVPGNCHLHGRAPVGRCWVSLVGLWALGVVCGCWVPFVGIVHGCWVICRLWVVGSGAPLCACTLFCCRGSLLGLGLLLGVVSLLGLGSSMGVWCSSQRMTTNNDFQSSFVMRLPRPCQ